MFKSKRFERFMNVLAVIFFTGLSVQNYGVADAGHMVLYFVALALTATALVVID